MSKCSGFQKSFYLDIMTKCVYNKDHSDYDFSGPYWHIKYREPSKYITEFEDMVIDLLKRDITHDLFGMNYWDLMDMELYKFNKLKKTILNIYQEREKQRDEMEKSQKQLQKTMKDMKHG